MSEVLKCSSCGGSNQLPDGKNSMFCAFCGNAIEKKVSINSMKKEWPQIIIKGKKEIPFKETEWYQNKLLEAKVRSDMDINMFKSTGKIPLVTDNIANIEHYRTEGGYNVKVIRHKKDSLDYFEKEKIVTEFVPFEYNYEKFSAKLVLNNMGIESFSEILNYYDEKEIKLITHLELNNNSIQNWDGIKEFDWLIDLSIVNNKIQSFPKDWERKNKKDGYSVYFQSINLNSNLIKSIPKKYPLERDTIVSLLNNPIELNSSKVTLYDEQFNLEIDINGKVNLKNDAFDKKQEFLSEEIPCKKCNVIKSRVLLEENGLCFSCNSNTTLSSKEGRCFIATSTMGSYDHPQVMELRQFRDEWILKKNWGDSFVTWYYYYGEKVAKVIEKSSVLKKLSYLLIVKPLVYLSRIVKK